MQKQTKGVKVNEIDLELVLDSGKIDIFIHHIYMRTISKHGCECYAN